jgi:hypothetical protein
LTYGSFEFMGIIRDAIGSANLLWRSRSCVDDGQ